MPKKDVKILSKELKELENKKEAISENKSTKEYKSLVTRIANVKQMIKKRENQEACMDNFELNNLELVEKLKKSLHQYFIKGNRSSEKIKDIHFYINCILRFKLSKKLHKDILKDIDIISEPYGETLASGYIYDKNIDISVKYRNRVIGIVSVKFYMSNYSQNAYNYLENVLGESINLKYNKPNRVFWFCIFSFNDIPYFDAKNNIDTKKTSKIKSEKYLNLHQNKANIFPDYISITLIDNDIGNMLHPNKLLNKSEQNVKQVVDRLFKNNKLLHDKTMNFFHVLDRFVLDIVKKIKNHNLLQTSSATSLNS